MRARVRASRVCYFAPRARPQIVNDGVVNDRRARGRVLVRACVRTNLYIMYESEPGNCKADVADDRCAMAAFVDRVSRLDKRGSRLVTGLA